MLPRALDPEHGGVYPASLIGHIAHDTWSVLLAAYEEGSAQSTRASSLLSTPSSQNSTFGEHADQSKTLANQARFNAGYVLTLAQRQQRAMTHARDTSSAAAVFITCIAIARAVAVVGPPPGHSVRC
ncbi:MAG: hypothetical protein ACK5ZS_00280 [bacterium]